MKARGRQARPGPGLAAAIAAIAIPAQAWAHAGERGFVLLLPTDYYIAGGVAAVAVSFVVLLLLPGAAVDRVATARVALGSLPRLPATALSGLAFLLLVGLLLSGVFGSRDPLANPLPLWVWTLWWVGLTLAHALFGNLWAVLNPWLAPCRLLRPLIRSPLPYPTWLGYWPAVLGFLAFAWLELVHPAPDDPERLALAVAVYTGVTLAGMLAFGEAAWLARAECFSVFFAFVARLAPLRIEPAGERYRLSLTCPGAALVGRDPLPLGGVLFVLLTLATVSFDGLSRTFWWLDLGGINPLDFPGRTAVMGLNSLGLVLTWGALALGYLAAIALGLRLAGGGIPLRDTLGAFVLSILPISLAYHFAHYLTVFMVNAQYAVLAASDPLDRGWDLFGLGHRHVTVSFLSDYHAVSVIWKVQAGAIVLGHVLAVLLAHLIAGRRFASPSAAAASELPLTVLMIAYTLFGLWLLAAPTAG